MVTSPPYGPSTHGHVRTPGARRGKVRKIHHRYGDSDNLAYRDHDTLAEGFTEILAGCRVVLRPGGYVAITARPYRRHGELIDIPGMVVAAGQAARLELSEECVALMAGVREGVLVPRASFFQQKNVRDAIANGDPQWIPQHEDVIILQAPLGTAPATRWDLAQRGTGPDGAHADRLDAFTLSRVDRRADPAHRTDTRPDGSATDPRPSLGRDVERTPDPCPPSSHPAPAQVRPGTSAPRLPADQLHPQAESSDTAGQR